MPLGTCPLLFIGFKRCRRAYLWVQLDDHLERIAAASAFMASVLTENAN